MNYIITKHPDFFRKIGDYNFCGLAALESLPEEIALDTETTGLFALEEDIFCTQIGTRKNNYLIHMYDNNYTFYDIIPYIKDKTLVTQNGLFDLGFMYKYNFVPYKVYDTMLATKILYNGDWKNSRADFKSIMQRELGVFYDKTTQKNIHLVKLTQASAISYSFNDVDRLQECHDVLLKKIEDRGYISTYLLHCRFIKALAYMEQCGLPINSNTWLDKMKIDKNHVKEYTTEIIDFIHTYIPKFADKQMDLFDNKKRTILNFNSSSQMIPVFNALDIKTIDKDGKESIQEDIISKSDHPFVDLWLKFQRANHRVSTFGINVYNKIKNGRIYTNFNPMVDTARLSSRKGGINFLNFPSDGITRDCFEAPEGQKMIVCDWAGQETVIAADLSGDEAMTKSVVEGADLHCLLARELFPELGPLTDKEIIEEHSDKRTAAKAPRFAMQYGGNGYTLHVNENIPLRDAEEIFEKFVSLHQGLFDWGQRSLHKAIKRGHIESVDGWKLHLPKYDWFKTLKREVDNMSKADWSTYRIGKAERKREYLLQEANFKRKAGEEKIIFKPVNEDAYKFYKSKRNKISDYFSLRSTYSRLALNNPVQTRGAHQMKLALCYMFEWIVENGHMWKVLMCNAVHDETVCQAPDELAEETRDKVEEFMLKAGDYYLKTLKIKADANIGQTWYEAK